MTAAPVPDAATVAAAFHEAYERLAPDYGYTTREASAVPWDDVPAQNKALMTAVAAEVRPLIEAPLRAEYERLRDATDRIHDDLMRHAAGVEAERDALRQQVERLEALIREAPHGYNCDSLTATPSVTRKYACDCWKSRAALATDDGGT